MILTTQIRNIEDAIETILNECEYEQFISRVIAHNLSYDEDSINIIMGNKSKGVKSKPPLISVFFDTANINHAGSSLSEEWQFNIVLISLLISREPEVGRDLANTLALEASDYLIKNRTLNGTIRDIVRTGFTPGEERVEIGNSTFGAGVEMQLRFRVRT